MLASIVTFFAVQPNNDNRPNTKDYYGLLFMD